MSVSLARKFLGVKIVANYMNKSSLRKIFLAKQVALRDAERQKGSLQISERFFDIFDLDHVRVLHLFLSIVEKGELDTSSFINELWGNYINIKTIVPRIDSDKDRLEHVEFNSGSTLAVSSWGIPEPVGDDLVDERRIDLALVPLLCFDKRGYRVGYGKGYYDKFLVKCRDDCVKIGLSFFEPVEEIEDVQDFDVALDYCITPERIWDFTKTAETRTQ